jgi:hypothetical protein
VFLLQLWNKFSVGTQLMIWELYYSRICITEFYKTETFSPTCPFHNVRHAVTKDAHTGCWNLATSTCFIISHNHPTVSWSDVYSLCNSYHFYSVVIVTVFFYLVLCLNLTPQRKETYLCLKKFKEWATSTQSASWKIGKARVIASEYSVMLLMYKLLTQTFCKTWSFQGE